MNQTLVSNFALPKISKREEGLNEIVMMMYPKIVPSAWASTRGLIEVLNVIANCDVASRVGDGRGIGIDGAYATTCIVIEVLTRNCDKSDWICAKVFAIYHKNVFSRTSRKYLCVM